MIGKLFNNRYEILTKIGSGSFGDVFLGEDIQSRNKIAIKLEDVNSKDPRLRKEYEIYCSLIKIKGIPSVHWFGMDSEYRILVIDYIGPSLENVMNNNKCFNQNNVMKVGLKIIDLIEHLHNNGVVHRDIKPENFLINRNNCIYIIDFGLSRLYKDKNTNEHIKFSENNKLIGTPRYASINNHQGIEQSRRDDLESIGYMLIYILRGDLPWQGIKRDQTKENKYQNILDKKLSITIEELCKNLPEELEIYLKYTKTLKFQDTPNYSYLKGLFYNAIKSGKYLENS